MKALLSLFLLMALMAPAMAQPVITPANLTVNAGAAFTFTASSTNAVTFQWVYDGTNIDGATNAEYYADNPSTNQAGVYWVVTSNMDSSISSNSATLTVLQGTVVNFTISHFSDGSSSNVVVELFDHDKPATVENFVHYIRSIGYSNMFFDRLIPGFVLQGGDYDANDRTNSTPGLNAVNIYQNIVQGGEVTDPSIPYQIDSEFNVGPFVSNVKGTLALALPAGNPNGGNSGFFFNLVDNSGAPNYLDEQQFTVFGRVIGGTNVLDYFNDTNNFSKLAATNFPTNLVFTSNPFTNGIFDQVFLLTNATTLTDLPVNFYGTNIPADSNLFFVDFSFPDPNAQPYIDTTPPTATITFPAANQLVTNGFPLVIQGTASDNVGLAFVECTLYSVNGSYSLPLGEPALGTTNWSFNVDANFGSLSPGIYNIAATPQDGAGNLGTTVYQNNLIVTAVVTNGVGTVVLTNASTYPAAGSVLPDAVGAYLATGTYYVVGAQPGANQLFVNWNDNAGDPASHSSSIYFEMSDGYVLTATFISNGIPGSIAFTYPPSKGTANATNGVFTIQGTINGLPNPPVNISCQLYSESNDLAVGVPLQTTGTTSWTLQVTNLPDGPYLAQVIAQDATGRQTLITNSFTVQTLDPLMVMVNGPGAVTTNLNGQYLVPGKTYSMKATATANGVFENWNNNGNVTLNPVESFTMSPGLTLTANFATNALPGAIAFTYPIAGKTAYATNGVLGIQGTIKAQASPPVAITCQVFSSAGALGSPLQTSGTSSWSVQTNLPNGQYYAQVIAQDALGRMTIITNAFSVQTVNQMTVIVNGPGTVTTDYNGQYLPPGTKYSMKAQAGKNGVFENWSDGGNTTLNPTESFTMSSNLVLTATFLTNDIPGAIAFTYPIANAKLTNSALMLDGSIKPSMTATQIVCQLFSNSGAITGPVVAANTAAAWSVPAGNLVPGLTNLAPGNYTAVATAYNATGEGTLISQNFSILAHLSIVTSSNVVLPPIYDTSNTNMVNTNIMMVPPQLLGTISLANSNGGYLTAGASYTIVAKPKPGYLFAYWALNGVTNYSSSYTFSLASDQTITANFASNYFPRVAGTYDGIFYPPNTDANSTNSGYFTMSILSQGTATISVSFPGKTASYKLAGALPYYCSVDAELPGLDNNGLVLAFGMDLTNLLGSFTGYVYDLNGSWFGSLTAYRVATGLGANSAVVPGRYALAMPGLHGTNTTEPGGDSVATYSISSAGAVVVSGSLADGMPFTQSTGVSSNGIWPLYVPLYPTKGVPTGVILGWQTNGLPTNYSGQVEWFKPVTAAKAGTYYNNGFAVQLSTAPAVYTEPVANTHYQIVFNGATLSGPQTNTLTVSPAHVFTADPGQKNLQVTLAVATGAITGQFMATNNTIKKITGAFSNPASGGSGYFLDTDGQTGFFEISLLP